MRSPRIANALAVLALPLAFVACAEQSGSVPEVPEAELVADVPELSAVHEFMQPLWHDAFPERDFAKIQELVPEFEPRLEALSEVDLSGILQDKQEDWAEGKANLMEAFHGLKAAAEAGNEEEMLGYAETFHMGYERLVRIIRPVVPELEVVHQHLYGMYHYYGPGYDLEKIGTAAQEMAAAIPALQAAELPSRLADHQEEFTAGAVRLGEAVDALISTLEDPSRDAVEADIEAVHSAYAAIEGIFDGGSHG
jgi:hypothetical protein